MKNLSVDIKQKKFARSDVSVLSDIKFSAKSGEFLAIVGPSGSGKTTMLNIIAGLDSDFQGDIVINQQTSNQKMKIGMVFQDARLLPWLSVVDNVRLVLGYDQEHTRHAKKLLSAVGLSEYADAYPNQLSGGMQRRLALVRAFSVKPGLLLLDEPFISLDVPTANRLRELLIELWQTWNPTILFVTHDLREALAMADRVLFFSSSPGRIVFELPINLKRPRGLARDLESPELNQLYTDLLKQYPDLLSGLVRKS